MDKAYKEDIPKYLKTLMELRREFARNQTNTDWIRLRIDPLVRHVRSLDRVLRSSGFSNERIRLPLGVSMFRADLVYLRENIKTLKAILARENRRLGKLKSEG